MKKRKKMSQLMEYAGSYRMLIYLSWVLVAISAVLAFFPFVYIWKIIEEVLLKSSDLNNAISLVHKGWMAFLLILLSMFFLCSWFNVFSCCSFSGGE